MHDRKGQWNGLSVEKIIALFFSAKRSSVALMSCSLWNIMKDFVCASACASVCETGLGLLSLHYTRAGSTPVLCPRSLPLPVPARNNELQWMPWGGWVSGSEVDSILAQITSQIHSNGSLGLLSAFSAYSCLRVKWSIHTFSPFKRLWFSFWSQFLQWVKSRGGKPQTNKSMNA